MQADTLSYPVLISTQCTPLIAWLAKGLSVKLTQEQGSWVWDRIDEWKLNPKPTVLHSSYRERYTFTVINDAWRHKQHIIHRDAPQEMKVYSSNTCNRTLCCSCAVIKLAQNEIHLNWLKYKQVEHQYFLHRLWCKCPYIETTVTSSLSLFSGKKNMTHQNMPFLCPSICESMEMYTFLWDATKGRQKRPCNGGIIA